MDKHALLFLNFDNSIIIGIRWKNPVSITSVLSAETYNPHLVAIYHEVVSHKFIVE